MLLYNKACLLYTSVGSQKLMSAITEIENDLQEEVRAFQESDVYKRQVFGLSGDYGSSDEVMAFTLTNFLPSAILYLTMLALSAVVFFRAAFTFSDVQKLSLIHI